MQPLWQTPLLPLLYVWAAAFIGIATTIGAMMLSAWRGSVRSISRSWTSWSELTLKLIKWWVIVRLADIVVRAIFFGEFMKMLTPWYLPLLFWAEMAFIAVPAWRLRQKEVRENAVSALPELLLHRDGRLGYRFDPTTFAYRHWHDRRVLHAGA